MKVCFTGCKFGGSGKDKLKKNLNSREINCNELINNVHNILQWHCTSLNFKF